MKFWILKLHSTQVALVDFSLELETTSGLVLARLIFIMKIIIKIIIVRLRRIFLSKDRKVKRT